MTTRRCGYAAASLAGLFWLGLLYVVIVRPQISGDTSALVTGAHAVRDCIENGRIGDCPQAQHFALLQYLPAFVLDMVGLSVDHAMRVLAVLSLIAYAGMTLLIVVALNRLVPRGGWALGLLLMLSGPFIWYATASFGEALAAWAVAAFAVALLLRWPAWAVVILGLLAAISKETSPPLLLLLALACYLLRAGTFRRRDLLTWGLPVGLGLLGGATASALFNQIRFGAFSNPVLLQPSFRTPGNRLKTEFFTGLWLSPNAGFIALWPVLVGLVVFAGVWALRAIRRNRPESVAVLTVLLVLALSTAGLATWAFPFGWIAWGPRLSLPIIPAAALILLVAVGPALVRRLQRVWVAVLVGALAAWGLLVNVGATVAAGKVLAQTFFVPVGACAQDTVIQSNPTGYFQCMSQMTWQPTRTVLVALSEAWHGWGIVVSLAGMLALSCCVLAIIWQGRAPRAEPAIKG